MGDLSYEFDIQASDNSLSIIKVIGVGGGGSNAVNHMYRQGIKDVDFYVCNTDIQALDTSPVPNKIQIGKTLTEGLGAGANPEVGKNAAVENKQELRDLLNDGTKMLFITAGMGGGTGTGAAPIIAEIAQELDILTVGIVTSPFGFEGKPKRRRADDGISELEKYCDTVLVILNEKLKEVFGKASMKQAFGQADDVLLKGAKSIAEIITVSGVINVDFEDVRTVMKDSGAAVMGSATADGDDRAIRAAEGALTSPLLNNTNIQGAKHILLSIVVGDDDDFQMDELEEITDFVQEKAGDSAEIIFGQAIDDTLGNSISVTIIATGFEEDEKEQEREVFDLETSKRITKQVATPPRNDFFDPEDQEEEFPSTIIQRSKPEKIVFELEGDYEIVDEDPVDNKFEELERKYQVRREKLQNLRPITEMSPEELKEKQEMPAYLRKGVDLTSASHSSESNLSRYNIDEDNDLLGDNKFLHDNVD